MGSREGLTCGAGTPETKLHLPAAAWLTAALALSNSQRIIFDFHIYMVLLSLLSGSLLQGSARKNLQITSLDVT